MEENHPNAVTSPFSSSSSHSYESSNSLIKLKYYGLQKRHFFKTFRKNLMQLATYVFTASPPFRTAHKIMSIIRIMQFLLPCLIPSYFVFWKEGTVEQVAMNIISVLYYFIPPTAFFDAAYIFLIVYDIIEFLIIFIVIYSSYYYKKYAKLPAFVPPSINFYHSTIGYYIYPILLFTIFEYFSFLATNPNRIKISLTNFIVLAIISIICTFFNYLFMIVSTNQTLLLRPNSLASLTSYPRFIIIISTSLINIFFGIAVNLRKTYKIIFFSINILLYLFTIFSIFTYGGFIHVSSSNIVLSSSITGAVFTAVDLIIIILEKNGSLAIFFSFIVFFIIMMIIDYFIVQHITFKYLKLLDSIYEDKELFSLIKSPNHFLQIATVGIKYSHPIIINLDYFLMGIERWEKNQLIYFVYAKFISIYPEETITLKYIYQSVKMQKLSGSAITCIKNQTKMILNQREIGLTNELRSNLNSLKKQYRTTKHKLGHLWDVVIRGNTSEIEVATKHAIQAINETNANFKHLIHDFQNNRNVYHFYACFLNELMADKSLSDEMYKKAKLMHPGSALIIYDQMHDYGTKMFPNLPNLLKPKETIITSSVADTVPQYANESNEGDLEKEKERNINQVAGIKDNIDELKIPSILGSKILIILTFLLLFFIPCFCGLIYIHFYIKKLQEPLEFVGSLTKLETYAYQIIGFSIRYIGESLSIFNKLDIQKNDPPLSLGGSWDTKDQLSYILNATTYALQEFASFRMFDEKNQYINEVQNLIFQNTIPYKYFLSSSNTVTTMISIQSALLDFTIKTKTIVTGLEISPSILEADTVLNPINNIISISYNFRNALNLMNQYISSNYSNAVKITDILLIVLIITIVVVNSIVLIIEIKWINSNKQETYQCFFSLPKNIVSELVENIFSKNVNKQSEEMNKQDENIIKIFHSGGYSEDSLADSVVLIICTVLIVLLSVCSTILFILLVKDLTKIVRNSAPHLHYLLGTYSMSLGAFNHLQTILFEFGGNPIPTNNFYSSFIYMNNYFNFSRQYYHLLTTGGSHAEEVPFRRFIDGVRRASPKNCSSSSFHSLVSEIKELTKKRKRIMNNQDKLDFHFSNKLIKEGFNDLSSILKCSPIDLTIVLIEPIILYSIIPYQKGEMKTIDPKSPAYETIWLQMISPLYDLFYEPLNQDIIPTIDEELKSKRNQFIPFIIAFLIIGVIIEIILYLQIGKIETHIRSVLRLLLHCSPSVIFSSSKITRVLSGDFSMQKNDSLERNNTFFDTVFKSLPDAIMYANSDMIIQSANQACESTFGNIQLVGKSIYDFFMSGNFTGNIEVLFSSVNSNPTEEIAYKLDKSSDLRILKASSMIACGMFVMSCRNVTQSHRYNTLILEEKQNSDKLLKTILPPTLVSRVQEGEKNISFSVQSASILFCDIVSFTPWCGSLPAETVMSTLNILFKQFDSILDSKPTMTKVKCIGDCYMAAGGIFAELNQPAIHAKEVVSFGLQCIKEIVVINKEIHQNLKVRIGVNTGGPIVAGVLGIGKPTFEILGPAINRAQQMEQNGMPMMVHISMPVYELICGFNFKFENRRSIRIKNEVVETYLVEP